MQGKATIAGHPVHPMLVAFPIGFFVGTIVCYIIYGITGDTTFWPRMAVVLMLFGIISALIAALFGFIDYFTARMAGAVKSTATTHMLLNLSVVVLFVIALWQGWARPTNPASIWLSVIGVILLVPSGWLGGKLTFIGHVGAAESPTSGGGSGEQTRRVAS